MQPNTALVARVRADLAAAGDPERAAAQQAYMKSALPYHGIASTELKKLLRPILAGHRIDDRQAWEATVRELWDGATHREQRYAATALLGHRFYRGWQDPELLPMHRHLIVTGAWWDHVDELATRHVGPILAGHRAEVTPLMRAWSRTEDLWLRRTAILCQLHHKEQTDLDLLREAIDANVDDRSFWIRKAIGWALRQYARTDPDWVRSEVARHGDRLSGLSRREAMKHLQ
ncbi:DNA alkylation repair protein [Nocardioides speluncae]|uniref:DNA alkylation repair protein n=1 Tax=Nocardioides speluncae TaxID=2670337 RepID=UPI000D689A79|nr:DNA alkylation repair protein [Nocardioides speluncae]